MAQEGGTNEEIKEFVCTKYEGHFPLFAKIDVNGHNTHEIYKFLRLNSELYDQKKQEVKDIPWNFAKFIVNEKGQVVSFHQPSEEPLSLVDEIEKVLGIKQF